MTTGGGGGGTGGGGGAGGVAIGGWRRGLEEHILFARILFSAIRAELRLCPNMVIHSRHSLI